MRFYGFGSGKDGLHQTEALVELLAHARGKFSKITRPDLDVTGVPTDDPWPEWGLNTRFKTSYGVGRATRDAVCSWCEICMQVWELRICAPGADEPSQWKVNDSGRSANGVWPKFHGGGKLGTSKHMHQHQVTISLDAFCRGAARGSAGGAGFFAPLGFGTDFDTSSTAPNINEQRDIALLNVLRQHIGDGAYNWISNRSGGYARQTYKLMQRILNTMMSADITWCLPLVPITDSIEQENVISLVLQMANYISTGVFNTIRPLGDLLSEFRTMLMMYFLPQRGTNAPDAWGSSAPYAIKAPKPIDQGFADCPTEYQQARSWAESIMNTIARDASGDDVVSRDWVWAIRNGYTWKDRWDVEVGNGFFGKPIVSNQVFGLLQRLHNQQRTAPVDILDQPIIPSAGDNNWVEGERTMVLIEPLLPVQISVGQSIEIKIQVNNTFVIWPQYTGLDNIPFFIGARDDRDDFGISARRFVPAPDQLGLHSLVMQQGSGDAKTSVTVTVTVVAAAIAGNDQLWLEFDEIIHSNGNHYVHVVAQWTTEIGSDYDVDPAWHVGQFYPDPAFVWYWFPGGVATAQTNQPVSRTDDGTTATFKTEAWFSVPNGPAGVGTTRDVRVLVSPLGPVVPPIFDVSYVYLIQGTCTEV